MDEEFELNEEACDKLYGLIFAKLANSNRMRVEDISTDIEKHHTLRRTIVRTAYELGKTVSRHEPPNASLTGAQNPSIKKPPAV